MDVRQRRDSVKERNRGGMKKIILVEADLDRKCSLQNLVRFSEAYQRKLDEVGDDCIVLPVPSDIHLRTLDKDELDIIIERLQDVREKLGE